MTKDIEKDYAKAFVALLDRGTKKEALIEGLVYSVKSNFHESKIEKIVTEIEKILVHREGGRNIVCESARPLTKKNKEEITSKFSSKDRLNFKINSDLVAGVRFIFDDTMELDKSFRHKLKVLFSQ